MWHIILNNLESIDDIDNYINTLSEIDLYNSYVWLEHEFSEIPCFESDSSEPTGNLLILKKIHERFYTLPPESWDLLYKTRVFSHAFLKTFKEIIDFEKLIQNQFLDSIDIIELNEKIDFSLLSKYQNIPERILILFHEKIDFNVVMWNQKLPEWILKQFYYKIDPIVLLSTQKLSEGFLKTLILKVNTDLKFENCIEESDEQLYFKTVLWPYIVTFQKISKDLIHFIYKHKVRSESLLIKKLFGSLIAKFQDLDYNLLCEYREILCWWSVSSHQRLSDQCLIDFCFLIDFNIYKSRGIIISNYVIQNLPKPFVDFSDTLDCSICLDCHNSGVSLVKCKHVFCNSCITRWLKLNKFCPLCRTETIYFDL
jgi:hypothetical protein